MNMGGTLAAQKASFSLRFGGTSWYETPNLNVALPGGTVSQPLSLRQPSSNKFVQALLDYALTKDQTLRLTYTEQDNTGDNLGVGAYDLAERAYSNRLANRSFRRAGSRADWTPAVSEQPFRAQPHGLSQRSELEAADHSRERRVHERRRPGVGRQAFEVLRFAVRSRLRPRSPLGQGRDQFADADRACRHELELPRHVHLRQPRGVPGRTADELLTPHRRPDDRHVEPDDRPFTCRTTSAYGRTSRSARACGTKCSRISTTTTTSALGFGFTWAPFKSGRTTFRGSAGIFYDWMNQGTLEQVDAGGRPASAAGQHLQPVVSGSRRDHGRAPGRSLPVRSVAHDAEEYTLLGRYRSAAAAVACA